MDKKRNTKYEMRNTKKMIGLHAHTLLSDGELLPSELVRRAEAKGYKAIALTDHVDASNIDFVLPRIVKVCKVLNKSWKIVAIPGVEITHVPLSQIKALVKYSRKHGAKIVVVHGETVSEPVLPGTNRSAIEAGCDILAHPGMITRGDVILAKRRGVYLEITTRRSHSKPNKRLYRLAKSVGAKMILNTDAHDGCDLVTHEEAIRFLKRIGICSEHINNIFSNAELLLKKNSVKRTRS